MFDYVVFLYFLKHVILSRDFVELMGYCNSLQAQYRDRNVERIERQLRISKLFPWYSISQLWKCDHHNGKSLLCL